MEFDRYLVILHEYDSLVSYAKGISERLTGRTIESQIESYADAIFTKLLCHAISLRALSPSLDSKNQPEVWDVASASAIARALIESFDALAYIALHPISEDERKFRIVLWELHDQQRRLRMLEKIGSKDPRVEEIRNRATELADRLIAEPSYALASTELRSKISRDDAPAFHLSQRELNIAGAVDNDYYVAATMHLSQYVHTFPMSLHQLMHFRAGEQEALHACSMPLQYSMAFLAKAISGMVKLFPSGYVDPDASVRVVIERWLAVVEKGVNVPPKPAVNTDAAR